MSAMMYTFRPRDVNPEHYEQKMQFWKDLIECYCEYKGMKFYLSLLTHLTSYF